MSLKAFHIFFIAVSILLALGVGLWGVNIYLEDTNVDYLLFGIGSLLTGAALIAYGVKMLRRFRSL